MPDTRPGAPLDLSIFDNLETPAGQALVAPPEQPLTVAPAASLPATADPRLAATPVPERLVEIANLGPDDLKAAEASASKINFRDTNSLLAHGEGVLAGIAAASRQLLTGVRLGEAGEIGRIAASVIDGVKILRIEDLQAEAGGGAPGARSGIMGKLLGFMADAHTAFKGFTENRKKFLDLMDGEQARAR